MRIMENDRPRLKFLGSAATAACLAVLLAACSSDATRLSENPFANPFQSRAGLDPSTTNSLPRGNLNAAPLASAPTGQVISQALPAPSQPLLRTPAPRGVVAGGVAAANYPALSAPAPSSQVSSLGSGITGGTGRLVAPSSSIASEASERLVANSDIPRPAAPRLVAPLAESEAEKRAAAKLKQLRANPVSETEEKAAPAKPSKPQSRLKPPAERPTIAERETIQASQKAEKAQLAAKQAEIAATQRKKAEKEFAERQRAEAQKLAEEKAAQAKLNKAKLAQAKKQSASDETITTASLPSSPAPAVSAPRIAEKPAEPIAQPEEKPVSFRWPAQGRVISGFGARGANGSNDGINIAVPEGSPVHAAEGGTVVHADDALKGYGKLVLIRHPNGYVSVYAHNGELNVKRGETVRRGQVIAKSGQTGNVTSPQVHFEIRKGATPIDPSSLLASN